jgi:type VI secretion system protein ImpA
MPSTEVLDFAKLLAPIPGEKPAGSDLRTDTSPVSDFHAIRDARRAAREAERRIDTGDEPQETPDWRPVMERATKVLAEKSKDLELTAYLIEALVRLNGFPGLRDGFRLARELIERFWDGLLPAANDGEMPDARFSHILYLSGIDAPGTLIVPVRKIAMTAATSLGSLNLTHHQLAQSLNQVSDAKLRAKRIEDGAITMEMIQKAVAETPASFYAERLEGLGQCEEEFRRFCGALKEKSGYDPPSSDLRQVLELYGVVVKDLARDKLPKAAPAPALANGDVGKKEAGPAEKIDPSVIRDRADAIERLKKIADYFRMHEPHSMIPYVLDQAANWSRMSLPELLSELIPEETARKNLFKQVGIKPPEPKK